MIATTETTDYTSNQPAYRALVPVVMIASHTLTSAIITAGYARMWSNRVGSVTTCECGGWTDWVCMIHEHRARDYTDGSLKDHKQLKQMVL